MANLFEVLVSRLRALLLTDAGLDLEAEFLSRDARRRAELLRQADGYEAEGLKEVASALRQQAGAMSAQQPMATATPSLGLTNDNPAGAVADVGSDRQLAHAGTDDMTTAARNAEQPPRMDRAASDSPIPSSQDGKTNGTSAPATLPPAKSSSVGRIKPPRQKKRR